jgi:predicted helicase
VEAVFKSYCRGVATNADTYVYDHDRERLKARAERMVEDFNAQLDRWRRKGQPEDLDGFLRIDEKVHKWVRKTKRVLLRGKHLTFDEGTLRRAQYRPFTRLWHFFDPSFNEDLYRFPSFLPRPGSEDENLVIAVTDVGSEKPFMALTARSICDLHLVGAGSSCQCFPFYVYDEDGSNQRENVTDWALQQFRTRYKSDKITKWDLFHYVYGILHHPGYRVRFADNLKRDLPRIPFAPDFRAFADAGRQLANLHLNYETLDPFPLTFLETPEVPLSYAVTDKMKLSADKASLRVNPTLTLSGIPPQVFEYGLGNRSALEWVLDQISGQRRRSVGHPVRSEPVARPGVRRPVGQAGDPDQHRDGEDRVKTPRRVHDVTRFVRDSADPDQTLVLAGKKEGRMPIPPMNEHGLLPLDIYDCTLE